MPTAIAHVHITATDLLVADETWIATALLHREHPERSDFAVLEIVERARAENIQGTLRPGVKAHAYSHAVANREPDPHRYRMLYATGKSTRRLYRDGDDAHPKRQGKIAPEPGAIPDAYRYLLDWYRGEYSARAPDLWLKGVFDMIGAGKDIYAGTDPDEHVRRLREGWD